MESADALNRSRDLDRLWQDAVAMVEGELSDDAVSEAYEVYRAELARSRLADRVGDLEVMLAGGVVLRGRLVVDEPVADCLILGTPEGERWAVAASAVMTLRGGATGLRPEQEDAPSRLTSILRGEERSVVEVCLRDGQRWQSTLLAVAGDHLVLARSSEEVLVPFSAVAALGLASRDG